jgi:hypothetical protein
MAVRAIIARESCIQQIKELELVLAEGGSSQVLLDECVIVLHSLRMLSVHVVKCIAEWRKQLIYSYLLTAGNAAASSQYGMHMVNERNSMNKFKTVPFVWEGENYLLKMKGDSQFLFQSEYQKYFNFSTKSDPFLVQASVKHTQSTSQTYPISVGGGAQGLKNLRKQQTGQLKEIKEAAAPRNGPRKLVVPLTNHIKKIIRYCEAYLMDEAVTDKILRNGAAAHLKTTTEVP